MTPPEPTCGARHTKMRLHGRFPWSHSTEEVKKLPSQLYTG